MATARSPKIVLTVNHASGAGYYAMAGQGFDPDFIFSWPTGRMGVMEGESAIQAVHGRALETAKKKGSKLPPEVEKSVDEMREDYEHQLDARYAAARGFVDAIVHPEETREVLVMALTAAMQNPRSEERRVGKEWRSWWVRAGGMWKPRTVWDRRRCP